jgi:hypothetical protein
MIIMIILFFQIYYSLLDFHINKKHIMECIFLLNEQLLC